MWVVDVPCRFVCLSFGRVHASFHHASKSDSCQDKYKKNKAKITAEVIKIEHLNLSIALRRGRRYSPMMNVRSEECQAPSSPNRRERGARHSDPGSAVHSSSLIPMFQRTSLTALNSRPAAAASGAGSAPRLTGQAAAVNLDQTIDGRIERRNRRSGLCEKLNKLHQEKRRSEQLAKAQITKLKAELRARDREIYRMQNATMVFDTERIWDLEQQIKELKGQLATKSIASEEATQYFSCVWPSTPSIASTDDLMDMAQDGDHFGDMTALVNKPHRARPSILTPPATSPTWPVSPFSKDVSPTSDAPPEADKKQLEDEIAALKFQVQKLQATLDLYNALGARICDALPDGALKETGTLCSPETVENQVQLLLQTMSEQAASVAHLTAVISELGFPGTDAIEMMMSLISGFRAARLELEYLAPGEIKLPLTARGADILDLLLDHLRTLSTKTREDEDSIDAYHQTERSLRKQIDSRTFVMEELNIKIAEAYRTLNEKDGRIRELEIGNDRLKGDITELQGLMQRMETEHRESLNAHAAQQKSCQELLNAKDATIAELEARVEEAVSPTVRRSERRR
ncbi:hypothetical protein HDV63DRAFT_299843 [Trichoderma sp. SZMC 28014]